MFAQLQFQVATAKLLETKISAQKEVNRAKGKELANHLNSYPSADDS
jgi:hypothetical protein